MVAKIVASTFKYSSASAVSHSINLPTLRNNDGDGTDELVINSSHVIVVWTSQRDGGSTTNTRLAGPAPTGWTGVNLDTSWNGNYGSVVGAYVRQAVPGSQGTATPGFGYSGVARAGVVMGALVIEGLQSASVIGGAGGASYANPTTKITTGTATQTASGTSDVLWLALYGGNIDATADGLTISDSTGEWNNLFWYKPVGQGHFLFAAVDERSPTLPTASFTFTPTPTASGTNYSRSLIALPIQSNPAPVIDAASLQTVHRIIVSASDYTTFTATPPVGSGITVTPTADGFDVIDNPSRTGPATIVLQATGPGGTTNRNVDLPNFGGGGSGQGAADILVYIGGTYV